MSLAYVKKLAKDIIDMQLGGATPKALASMRALKTAETMSEFYKACEILKNARPDEPLLFNGINFVKKKAKTISEVTTLADDYLDLIDVSTMETINNASDLIKNGMTVMTHCGSSVVWEAIILAKHEGKKINVINTETRPNYQGRKTAQALASEDIKITYIVDGAVGAFIKDVDLVLVGADVLRDNYFINKIGTLPLAYVAQNNNKRMYSVSQLLKYSAHELPIEQRNPDEVWKIHNKNIEVRNPAFDKIPLSRITGIVTEKGILKKEIKNHAKKAYSW